MQLLTEKMCLSGFVPRLYFIFFVSLIPSAVQGAAVSQITDHLDKAWSLVVLGVLASAACVMVLVYAIFNCNDCYNSEVSTDTHPATNSGVKWGGAGGYSSAATADVGDNMMSAGFTGEVVNYGQGGNQVLPYAMIPTQVPEAQGFRGYEAPGTQGFSGYSGQGGGGWGSAPPQSPQGQGGLGAGQRAGAHNMPGAHISPMMQPEPEEPPPAYGEAAYRS